MEIEVEVNSEGIRVTASGGNLVFPTFGELALKLGARRTRDSDISSFSGYPLTHQGGRRVLRELFGQGFTPEQIAEAVAQSIIQLYQAQHSSVTTRFSLTAAQSTLRTLPPQGGFVVMDGTVYRLTAVEDTDASSAVEFMTKRTQEERENLERAFNQALAQNSQELEGRVREASARALQGRLPPIPFDLVKMGLQAWSERDLLRFSLPFCYSPKYLSQGAGGDERIREIPPRIAGRMVKTLRVVFETDTNLCLRRTSLLFEDLSSEFEHYHQRCWGSYSFPVEPINLTDLPRICDQLQRVLEVINLSSLAIGHPRNLPEASSLWDKSSPTSGVGLDTRLEEAPVSQETIVREPATREPEPAPGWRA